jgi:FkbM family methyltransferase
MVLINAGRSRGTASMAARRNQQHRHQYPYHFRGVAYDREKCGALSLLCIAVGYLVFSLFMSTQLLVRTTIGQHNSIRRQDQHVVDADHPALHLQDLKLAENTDFFDATATDIIQTLQCHTLLASRSRIYKSGIPIYGRDEKKVDGVAPDTGDVEQRRRRMQADDGTNEEGLDPGLDDDKIFATPARVTGAHLFCLAAFPQITTAAIVPDDKDETAFWKTKVQCGVRGDKQQAILDLWSTARAEITDADILRKTLQFATEESITLLNKQLFVWAAPNDDGTTFMTTDLNEQALKQADNEYGGIAGLADNLGRGKLYVDVGSGLGYTAMAVAILYPGTEIVSIEAAPTNWLLQEMNWRCNDFGRHEDRAHVFLVGVGPSTGTSQMAKFVWRPTATTSTRAWSLNMEEEENNADPTKSEDDLELTVKLRPWHAIQAEAEIKGRDIDVFNVDCEGCEYNLIPALTATEFASISTIMGQVHWGYIPRLKLPSSQRGKATHERLCQHENFVRSSIECCAFPHLTVRSSYSGEVLVLDSENFPPKEVTVKDLAGNLCDRFDTWATEHDLDTVESDWGWFQVASMREKL